MVRIPVQEGDALVVATSISSKRPTTPTNFRWDDTNKLWKWDRNTDTDMVGQNYHIESSATFGGTYTEVSTSPKANPSSGTTVSFQDVAQTIAGQYYRVRAKNTNGIFSAYAGPLQWKDPADFCRTRWNVYDLLKIPFSQAFRPRVFFDLVDADEIESLDSHIYLLSGQERGQLSEQITGYGEKDVIRTSILGDINYNITIVAGEDTWKNDDTATGIAIEGTLDSVTGKYEVFLNGLGITFEKQS